MKMTREEALETLKENFCAMCAYGSQSMMSCDIRGCDNRDAIKALEQEPCVDAISRSEAIRIASGYCHPANIAKELGKLPSVLPEQNMGEWVPVSERLPEENGQYLITVKYKHVDDSYEDVYAENGDWSDGRWDMFCFGHCGEVEDIIAWMPLPEPYKAESEDKECIED